MTHPRTAAALAGCLLLAGCPVPPPGPTSMSGHQIVMGPTTTVSPPLGTATVTADCPANTVVVGGGYTSGDEAANAFESVPLPSGSGWRVSVRNENLAIYSFSFVPVAVCVDRPSGYQVVVGPTINLSSQQIASTEARCPDATYQITGSGLTSGDAQTHPFASLVGNQGQPSWTGSAKNNFVGGLPSNTSLSAAAICAALASVPGAIEASSSPVNIGPGSKTTLSVQCPAGTRALSGSIAAAVSVAMWFDSAPTAQGDGWMASLKNPSTFVDPVQISGATISVICAKA